MDIASLCTSGFLCFHIHSFKLFRLPTDYGSLCHLEEPAGTYLGSCFKALPKFAQIRMVIGTKQELVHITHMLCSSTKP